RPNLGPKGPQKAVHWAHDCVLQSGHEQDPRSGPIVLAARPRRRVSERRVAARLVERGLLVLGRLPRRDARQTRGPGVGQRRLLPERPVGRPRHGPRRHPRPSLRSQRLLHGQRLRLRVGRRDRPGVIPRSFWELLADSLLLLKEGFLEWLAIVSAGLLPGSLA